MAKKLGCLVILAGLALVLVVILAAALVRLSPPVTRPRVLIHSPHNGERIVVGRQTAVEALARDDQPIKRVELWVDDVLQDAQSGELRAPSSSFPVTMRWQPAVSGTHTVSIRAFNAEGEGSYATVHIQALAISDRDGDDMDDGSDACPDQAGSASARGCPDRDGDGIRDADDTCPDQSGLPNAHGCPAPSTRDRDGDGLSDVADTCPEQSGSPFASGCPDADGDRVADAVNACPQQPGSEPNGCSIPGDADGDGVADASDACPETPGLAEYAGCSDDDGDRVSAPNDACPDESGSLELAGCPDRDGDGVRDLVDQCPLAAGPASNSGCPVTASGDADNDGVHDDVDLAPNQAGLPEHGGALPPGRSPDQNGNQIPDDAEPQQNLVRVFGGLTIPSLDLDLGGVIPVPMEITQKYVTGVEIRALQFQTVSNPDLTDISCYVTLEYTLLQDGNPQDIMSVIPAGGELNLDPGSTTREWNLPEILGERIERFFVADTDYPIIVRVSCDGIISPPGETPHTYSLGRVTATHNSPWDGSVLEASSSGGDSGRSFHVHYQLCQVSCDSATFQAPVLSLFTFGNPELHWLYSGDLSQVRAFRVYVNGSMLHEMPTTADRYRISTHPAANPACGETYSYFVTAYGGDEGSPRESPPSNTVSLTGTSCPRTVRVTFDTLQAGNLGRDEREYNSVGPITGVFWASGSSRQSLPFHMSICGELTHCHHRDIQYGLRLDHNHTYQIYELFDWVSSQQVLCGINGCPASSYRAPAVDFVQVSLEGGQDLTFGGTVQNINWSYGSGSAWPMLFDSQDVVHAYRLLPGSTVDQTLSDRQIQLTVHVETLEE